jgi:hypothetical protein
LIVLAKSKSYIIDGTSSEQLFSDARTYHVLIDDSSTIDLEFAGQSCITKCQHMLEHLLSNKFADMARMIHNPEKKVILLMDIDS